MEYVINSMTFELVPAILFGIFLFLKCGEDRNTGIWFSKFYGYPSKSYMYAIQYVCMLLIISPPIDILMDSYNIICMTSHPSSRFFVAHPEGHHIHIDAARGWKPEVCGFQKTVQVCVKVHIHKKQMIM